MSVCVCLSVCVCTPVCLFVSLFSSSSKSDVPHFTPVLLRLEFIWRILSCQMANLYENHWAQIVDFISFVSSSESSTSPCSASQLGRHSLISLPPENTVDTFFTPVVRLCATPWTVARQAPLSMGFSRQEYGSGLPCPPPGDLPDPGMEPASLCLPHWLAGSLPLAPPGKSL